MKLEVVKDLKSNSYNVTMNVTDITDTDREKFSDFGEIVVDVGGIIYGEPEKEYQKYQKHPTKIVLVPLLDPVDKVTPILDSESQPINIETVVPDEDAPKVDVVDELGKPVYKLVDSESKVVVADLGTQLVKMPSEFPIVRSFKAIDFGGGEKTEAIVTAYVAMVEAKLKAQILEYDSKIDTFSGKAEFQL